MDLLIIGLSSIVTRRVLPALRSLPDVQRIDVATRKAADPVLREGWPFGTAYVDYEEALKRTSAQMAYISVVNSEHERWARAALDRRLHVVVDKPAFLGYESAARIVEFAAARDMCLAEATVFTYHPLMGTAMRLFGEAGDAPRRVSMALSFPPMDSTNFRYQSGLGGGALWDVGPYLVATSRHAFNAEPESVDCRVLARGDGNIDIAFSALGTFSEGRSLVGQFGFDTAYVNRLQMVGRSLVVEADRAFTTPPDYRSSIRTTRPDMSRTVEVPPADAFARFFENVIGRAEVHDWNQLTSDLLSDARVLERYRAVAGAS